MVSQEATTSQSLKETNLVRVLLSLKESSPLTKNTICTRLNLSRPTVGGAIIKLLSLGLAECNGQSPSDGGRRAVLYRFNGQACYAIGGDLELPELNLVLCGLDGIPVAAKGFIVPEDRVADPEKTLEFVSESIRAMAKDDAGAAVKHFHIH